MNMGQEHIATPSEHEEATTQGCATNLYMDASGSEQAAVRFKHESGDAPGSVGEDGESELSDQFQRSVQRWTASELKLLAELVAKHGTCRKWTIIAGQMSGRSGKQCRERWLNHTRPEIFKRGDWSAQEEFFLVKMHVEHGTCWSKMAKLLPGRSDNSIKNHFNATQRCKAALKTCSILWLYISCLKTGKSGQEAMGSAVREWSKRVPLSVFTELGADAIKEVGCMLMSPDASSASPKLDQAHVTLSQANAVEVIQPTPVTTSGEGLANMVVVDQQMSTLHHLPAGSQLLQQSISQAGHANEVPQSSLSAAGSILKNLMLPHQGRPAGASTSLAFPPLPASNGMGSDSLSMQPHDATQRLWNSISMQCTQGMLPLSAPCSLPHRSQVMSLPMSFNSGTAQGAFGYPQLISLGQGQQQEQMYTVVILPHGQNHSDETPTHHGSMPHVNPQQQQQQQLSWVIPTSQQLPWMAPAPQQQQQRQQRLLDKDAIAHSSAPSFFPKDQSMMSQQPVIGGLGYKSAISAFGTVLPPSSSPPAPAISAEGPNGALLKQLLGLPAPSPLLQQQNPISQVELLTQLQHLLSVSAK